MASNNFINECKNYANCNRLGELKIRDDLKINGLYGNTSQETTSGKNLLKPHVSSGGTSHGITYSYDETTQTYTFNGTCDTDNTTIRIGDSSSPLEVTTNTVASVHWVGGSVTNFCRLQIANDDWSKAIRVDIPNISSTNSIISSKSTTSFTALVYQNFRFNNGSVANNLKVKVMVANSDDTTYEPYTNGASPNPDYPQEVEVVTGRNEIDIVGKNLFPQPQPQTLNDVTFSINEDGTFNLSGTATANTGFIVFIDNESSGITNGETYTFSCTKPIPTGVEFRFEEYDNSTWKRAVLGANITSSSQTRTSTANITGGNRIRYNVYVANGTTVDFSNFGIQIEKGNQVTNFKKYEKQSYEINLGKNLFDKDNANVINAYISGSAKITGGSADKTIYIPCKPNTTYTIQKMLPRTTSKNRFRVGTSETIPVVNMTLNQYYNGGDGSNVTQYTITTNSTANYLVFFCYTTDTETTFDEIEASIQIEKGNQASSYSPYFTPIELCKIGNYEDSFYYQNESKNLFDKDNANIINASINTDRAIATSSNAKSLYISCLPNTTYSISKLGERFRVGTTTDIPIVGATCIDYVADDTATSLTITTSSNANYLLVYYFLNNTDTLTEQEILDSIQIEKGNQATEYQPYGSGWFIKKNIGKVILDGTESWYRTSTKTSGYYRFNCDIGTNILTESSVNTVGLFYSNKIVPKSRQNTYDCIDGIAPTTADYSYKSFNIYLDAWKNMTTTEVQNWLSSNNILVYYVLATPTYTKIDGALEGQLENIKNAKGQFGGTTLLVSSNNLSIIVDSTITEGLTLNQENYIQEFTIDSGCYVDGEIIGTIYSKKTEAKLIDSKTIDLQNKEFISKAGVVYSNNTNEYEELGKFTVESPKEEQTDNASSLVAYDDLINHIEDKYVTELNYDDEEISITLSDIYEELCRHLELTPVTTTFTNSNIPVEFNPFTNGEKNRDVLKAIEKVSCSFAKIDKWNNTIDLAWLSDTLDYTFTLDDYASLEGGKTIYGPINSLIIRNSEIEEENVSISDSESIAENGEHQLVITEDYFLYDAALREAAIQTIWNKVHNLTYVDCKLTTYTGKPFFNIGDKIRVYTSENDYFDTYILKHTFTFNGTFISEIESPVLTEQQIQTKQDVSLGDKLRNTQIIVNKQEGRIESLVSKTNTIDVTVNNNYQELNGKFNDYTPVSRTIEIENSVSTLQTDTYTKTEINTKLTDGSVTKVMTTSGTFDEDGMHYEKTNAPTSSTINEVGVGVKKTSDTNYVLFAGYVDDNNTQYSDFKGQTIVASENMLVKNYMVVGSKSRFEDYEDGTGCFYIGG